MTEDLQRDGREENRAADLSVLQPNHLALLRASGLDDATIVARGYRSVTRKGELERLGFTPAQRLVPTLLVPGQDVRGQRALLSTPTRRAAHSERQAGQVRDTQGREHDPGRAARCAAMDRRLVAGRAALDEAGFLPEWLPSASGLIKHVHRCLRDDGPAGAVQLTQRLHEAHVAFDLDRIAELECGGTSARPGARSEQRR